MTPSIGASMPPVAMDTAMLVLVLFQAYSVVPNTRNDPKNALEVSQFTKFYSRMVHHNDLNSF